MPSIPDWIIKARNKWQYTGQQRPDFAVTPKTGQESVWDYPRPPRIENDTREVIVRLGEIIIARTVHSKRVLETASPPTFYLPPEDIDLELLERCSGSSHCEWKGEASYWTVVANGQRLNQVGWSYEKPYPEFKDIQGYISFYPARLECYVDNCRVQPQSGEFYGGWVTAELVGPFKGEPGSGSW